MERLRVLYTPTKTYSKDFTCRARCGLREINSKWWKLPGRKQVFIDANAMAVTTCSSCRFTNRTAN